MAEGLYRVLIPLDGSPEAETALAAVVPLARRRPVHVTLFRAVGKNGAEEAAEAYLTKARGALETHGIPSEWKAAPSEPVSGILSLAREGGIDLIAMTTHGRTGPRRVLMGSVAEEVLRHAEVPVLITRPGTTLSEWDTLVVALDGSETAEKILPEAGFLAKALKARLHLVRVNVPILPVGDAGLDLWNGILTDPLLYLRKVCRRLEEEGVEAEPIFLTGDAAEEILRHAKKSGAGLIAMTTHGRTGPGRVLVGSVAEEVLRKTPCPVLVRRTVASAARVR